MYRGNLEDMPRELEREILFKIFKGAVSYGNIVPLMEKTSTKHNPYSIIECLEDDFSCFPDFWIIAEKDDLTNDNFFIVFERSLTVEEEISLWYVIRNILHIEDEVEPHSISKKFGIY